MDTSSKQSNANNAKAEKKARRAAKLAERPAEAQNGTHALKQGTQPQAPQPPSTKGKKPTADTTAKTVKKPNDPLPKQTEPASHWFEYFEDRPTISLQDQKVAGVHPSILALGLQIKNYEICGSQARCIGMLLAFKAVIKSYKTPDGTSLARHLSSHGLSPQITYLKSCRSLSVTQANAIRDLKNNIAAIDPSVAEDEAKRRLCTDIDTFIRERFSVADQVIAESCVNLIQNGDVILTFAHSAVVKQSLLLAASRGRRFSVIVADAAPLNEGKNMARTLSASLPAKSVEYCHFSSVSRIMSKATKVIVGVHALFANGKALSRVGTAGICAEAKHQCKPVVLLAETIKITERIAFDSFAINELLENTESQDKLTRLNPLFDITADENIDQIITEIGVSTPGNVSAFLRFKDS